MTTLESDEARLASAMGRLLQLDPPQLAPAQPRARHWLGAIVAGAAALVVVAGVVGGSIALHGRAPSGSTPQHPASPASGVVILSPAKLPAWVSVCLRTAGIGATAPSDGREPRLTRAEVIDDARAADSRVGVNPTTAFLQFHAPKVSPIASALEQPVWAVGVADIHFALPGLAVPTNQATDSPQPYFGAIIYFVSDPSGTVGLEIGCPRS
jgi:hypothetical protein